MQIPDSPSIAVIILTYNDLLVKKAIYSALHQTYLNTAIYVLDNGSTDRETKDILAAYESDNRVTVITSPLNLQSECASNFARDHVTADYISFLFSDDYWAADRVEKMITYAVANNYDAVFSNVDIVDGGGISIPVPASHFAGDISSMNRWQHLGHMFKGGNTLHPIAMLIKTDVYKTLGGFAGYLHLLGDMYFFAKLMVSDYTIGFMPEKLQYVTIHTKESKRQNVSADNLTNNPRWIFERIQFLDVFSSEAALANMEEIFSMPVKLGGMAERLYLLGIMAMNVMASDYIHFGFRCIYKAAEMDYKAVNDHCYQSQGISIGEYVKKLQAVYGTQSGAFVQFPPFLFVFHRGAIIQMAKKLFPAPLFNLIRKLRRR